MSDSKSSRETAGFFVADASVRWHFIDMALTDDLARSSKLRKLSIDDQSAIGDQFPLAGVVQPPVAPFAEQKAAPPMSFTPPGEGQGMSKTSVSQPIMMGSTATKQPAFGNRAGTGASQRGSMGAGMRASSGNNLATDQNTFGNRGGTGASQAGMLARARKPM
jgi:hypothetical protein